MAEISSQFDAMNSPLMEAHGDHRPKSRDKDAQKDDMWSSMLNSVASGKRLPEKNVLVLGGTPESQRDFLEGLSTDNRTVKDRRSRKPPPVANRFALGYTYQDVLDADHEDVLARLSIYLLCEPSPAFAPLLRPLLKPKTVADTLAIILLDWAQPWNWVRQLRDWISLLISVARDLDDETKRSMVDAMAEWRNRRSGGSAEGGGAAPTDPDVTIPLGPGEWDEELGIPLCVVCQYAEKTEVLEKDYGWQDEEFDYIQQFLRTILLKHGASLIYATPAANASLQTLIHSSLGIYSLLKRHPLKHNVIDRDRLLVPPNWDSWGKIRIIREGFDLEAVSNGWSVDIQPENSPSSPEHILFDKPQSPTTEEIASPLQSAPDTYTAHEPSLITLNMYSEVISDPARRGSINGLSTSSPTTGINSISGAMHSRTSSRIETSCISTQEFLTTQIPIVEKYKEADEKELSKSREKMAAIQTARGMTVDAGTGNSYDEGRVSEHIGPVQFNMGGIQVDAEDMLRRLKERDSTSTPDRDIAPPSVTTPESKAQNEALANFFAGLMKRGASSSNASTPRGANSGSG